jgi:hypothetical protein
MRASPAQCERARSTLLKYFGSNPGAFRGIINSKLCAESRKREDAEEKLKRCQKGVRGAAAKDKAAERAGLATVGRAAASTAHQQRLRNASAMGDGGDRPLPSRSSL